MLKTLARYIKEYKWVSIITPVFMLVEVIMELLIPKLMSIIVDDGIGKSNMTVVYTTGAIMLLFALISLAAGVLAGKYGAKASTGFAKNLREGMFNKIQTFSFSNIDKFSTAGLVTRLTTDVTNVQMAYQMLLRMCMRSPATLIFAMVMSFTISPKIAMIYLIAVVFLGLIMALIIKIATKYFNVAFPKYDALNESVQENVSAIRVVKAYVREEHEKEKFKKASFDIYKIFSKADHVIAFNSPAMMLTVYGCIMLISWVGAKMIVGSGGTELETGDLMNLLTYCMSILISLMMLSMVFVMMTMSLASAKRIAEVLDEQPDIVNPAEPVMNVADGSVVFEDVKFRYTSSSEEMVLSDINLSIKSGETIGIIGGTGSAKTSLVNLISRLYDVSGGSLKVGGVHQDHIL